MNSPLRPDASLPGLIAKFGGPAMGAIVGLVIMTILAGVQGILPGILFGGLLGLLFQVLAQNWVPFDFRKISEYKAPDPEWKQPGYIFDNTIPQETGEEISNSRLAKIFASILVIAFFVLMTLVILSTGTPMTVIS